MAITSVSAPTLSGTSVTAIAVNPANTTLYIGANPGLYTAGPVTGSNGGAALGTISTIATAPIASGLINSIAINSGNTNIYVAGSGGLCVATPASAGSVISTCTAATATGITAGTAINSVAVNAANTTVYIGTASSLYTAAPPSTPTTAISSATASAVPLPTGTLVKNDFVIDAANNLYFGVGSAFVMASPVTGSTAVSVLPAVLRPGNNTINAIKLVGGRAYVGTSNGLEVFSTPLTSVSPIIGAIWEGVTVNSVDVDTTNSIAYLGTSAGLCTVSTVGLTSGSVCTRATAGTISSSNITNVVVNAGTVYVTYGASGVGGTLCTALATLTATSAISTCNGVTSTALTTAAPGTVNTVAVSAASGTVYVGLTGGVCTAALSSGGASISTCTASPASGLNGVSVFNILPTASTVYIGSANGLCTASPVSGTATLGSCAQQYMVSLQNTNVTALATDNATRLYVGFGNNVASSALYYPGSCVATVPFSISYSPTCVVPATFMNNIFNTNSIAVDPTFTDTTGLLKVYTGTSGFGLLTSF